MDLMSTLIRRTNWLFMNELKSPLRNVFSLEFQSWLEETLYKLLINECFFTSKGYFA